MFRKVKYKRAALLLTLFSLALAADDQEANEHFARGRDLEKKENYSRAASAYMDARLMADSSVLKGNALIAAARAYRKAKLYGDEFDCLKKLVTEYIGGINFTQVVDRMYKIGDAFFEGHRDVAVSWLPFIKKEDRTLEIYEAALKYAPCADRAAEIRLRVARMYIDDQKPDDAIRHLREIPKLHPGTESAKYAMLELSDLLLQISERGDGDGSYSRQALEAFDNYLKEFPNSPEVPWVMKAREKVRNRIARRIHSVGEYYYQSGKPDLAEKYLADVVKNYSNTKQAAESENLLARIDKEYEILPGQERRYVPYKEAIKINSITPEAHPILITPEESDNRWLLPIRDLRSSVVANPDSITEKDKEVYREVMEEKEKQNAQKAGAVQK
ncbi:MAG: Outer membrane protein assembly factor BamD [Lentisphaerae bacterium ADurb.Bin242]|nr:MAG: Outer membrane protein assembly factor BamD [Lentisphaerae bacterium ADurb.Bin242]